MVGAERFLFYLNFIAEVVLLGRLIYYRLYRSYRPLFWYWLVQALTSLIMLRVPMRTYLYLYLYWGIQTISIAMAMTVQTSQLSEKYVSTAAQPIITSVT